MTANTKRTASAILDVCGVSRGVLLLHVVIVTAGMMMPLNLLNGMYGWQILLILGVVFSTCTWVLIGLFFALAVALGLFGFGDAGGYRDNLEEVVADYLVMKRSARTWLRRCMLSLQFMAVLFGFAQHEDTRGKGVMSVLFQLCLMSMVLGVILVVSNLTIHRSLHAYLAGPTVPVGPRTSAWIESAHAAIDAMNYEELHVLFLDALKRYRSSAERSRWEAMDDMEATAWNFTVFHRNETVPDDAVQTVELMIHAIQQIDPEAEETGLVSREKLVWRLAELLPVNTDAELASLEEQKLRKLDSGEQANPRSSRVIHLRRSPTGTTD